MSARARLDEMQQRADAATEGPWEIDREFDYDDAEWNPIIGVGPVAGDFHKHLSDDLYDDGSANAEFIAHARQDIPALVAALRTVLEVCADAEPWSEPLAERVIDHINEALEVEP